MTFYKLQTLKWQVDKVLQANLFLIGITVTFGISSFQINLDFD